MKLIDFINLKIRPGFRIEPGLFECKVSKEEMARLSKNNQIISSRYTQEGWYVMLQSNEIDKNVGDFFYFTRIYHLYDPLNRKDLFTEQKTKEIEEMRSIIDRIRRYASTNLFKPMLDESEYNFQKQLIMLRIITNMIMKEHSLYKIRMEWVNLITELFWERHRLVLEWRWNYIDKLPF